MSKNKSLILLTQIHNAFYLIEMPTEIFLSINTLKYLEQLNLFLENIWNKSNYFFLNQTKL